MFQFRRFPAYAYLIQRTLTEYCSAGFPHSEICGSKLMCSSPPVSYTHLIVLPRWDTYCVNCVTEGVRPPTPSIHRLRRGLPGYLILFATHAFVPQRQFWSSKPPSPLVFLPISTHLTATPGIPLASPILKPTSFKCNPHVKHGSFTPDLIGRLRTLYAQ